MAEMIDDDENNCPICFQSLNEQPDGISEGNPNLIMVGCCNKRFHSFCWEKSEKVFGTTDYKQFESLKNKLIQGCEYEARRCPLCRSLSDVLMIRSNQSKTNRSELNHSTENYNPISAITGLLFGNHLFPPSSSDYNQNESFSSMEIPMSVSISLTDSSPPQSLNQIRQSSNSNRFHRSSRFR